MIMLYQEELWQISFIEFKRFNNTELLLITSNPTLLHTVLTKLPARNMILLANYLNEQGDSFVGHALTLRLINEKWYL